MKKILFVCLGNICRSPSAEAIFAQKAEEAGMLVLSDSAGTGNWHVGNPPYPNMIAAAEQRGYDLTPLRARQVTARDFNSFDLIVTMDRSNTRDVEAIRPKGNGTEVVEMMSYAPQTGLDEVPDPYHTREFDVTIDLLEAAADGLVAALRRAEA